MPMPRKIKRLPRGVAKRYHGGVPAAVLAAELGVSTTTLLNAFRRAGVRVFPAGGRKSVSVRSRIARLWRRGYSQREIGEAVGVTRQRVSQIVNEGKRSEAE